MIDSILGIINKFIPDKDAAAKAAVALDKEMTKQMELKSGIIRAEIAQGGITSKWRPLTAICFVAMVVIHWFMYDVIPFIVVSFDLNIWTPQDPGFTDGLLSLIKLCLGGYIGSRSLEKIATKWKR